jgi:DNA-directed RNA polymerase subunit alpha
MENILLPSKMSFAPGAREHEAVLTVEPLFQGYGVTIGNALRRVLLSSLEGAAVTAVKINGATHEFSTVTGIKEDVLEILLNFKKLRIKVHATEPVVLKLDWKGEGAITAADIAPNADVEVVNKDLVLATATNKDSKFNAEITVSRGRGYGVTEEREHSGELGLMAIDSLFSPVLSVGLNVEHTRVGEITNYDKLVMTILTDGTITAQEAVDQSVKILLDHYNWIAGQLAHGSLSQENTAE